MKTELVHINSVNVGDMILCSDGIVRTVEPKNLKHGTFMGTTLFGDSYRLGTVKVTLVTNIN